MRLFEFMNSTTPYITSHFTTSETVLYAFLTSLCILLAFGIFSGITLGLIKLVDYFFSKSTLIGVVMTILTLSFVCTILILTFTL